MMHGKEVRANQAFQTDVGGRKKGRPANVTLSQSNLHTLLDELYLVFPGKYQSIDAMRRCQCSNVLKGQTTCGWLGMTERPLDFSNKPL